MKHGELGTLVYYFGLVIVVLSLAMVTIGATILGLLFMFWGLISAPKRHKRNMAVILLAILFILLILWLAAILKIAI